MRKPTNLLLLLVLLGDLLLHLLLGLGLESSQKFGDERRALGPVFLLSGSLGLSGNKRRYYKQNRLATHRLILFDLPLTGLSGSGISGRGLSGLTGDRRSLKEKITRE